MLKASCPHQRTTHPSGHAKEARGRLKLRQGRLVASKSSKSEPGSKDVSNRSSTCSAGDRCGSCPPLAVSHRPTCRLSRLSRASWLGHVLHRSLTLALSAAIALLPANSAWAGELPSTDAGKEAYERAVKRHKPTSRLPSEKEAEMFLQLDRDLFTDDAWEGMKTILEVARFVDRMEEAESEPGCKQCVSNRQLVEKAWQVIANEYYDPKGQFSQAAWAKKLLSTLQGAGGPLHTKQETYAAVHEMVASLQDKYTEFLTPAQYRKALRRPNPSERDYLERQYTGIGLQLGPHSSRGGWLVDGPLAESPAEEVGILAGQRLVEIDGYPADLLTPLEIAALMRGPAGSSVLLTLAENKPHSRTWTLDVERRALPQPPLKQAFVRASGQQAPLQYIRVHYFTSETTRAFANALLQADLAGAQGIIIDLRNNPGGVFEEAISMASLLLNRGCSIAKTVRNSEVVDNVFRVGYLSQEVFPRHPGIVTDLPVAVIVNHGSASASEVLAGALQDNGRAVLVGEQSFGKGVVQYYFQMSDGSGLKVTVAKYLTPGHDISREGGLVPSKACRDYPHPGTASAESDACIQAAVEGLQELSQKRRGTEGVVRFAQVSAE